MSLNLKITWGSGGSSARMMGLDDDLTLDSLKDAIEQKSGIAKERMTLKAGFPPRDINGNPTDRVLQLGVTSGSVLTVLESSHDAQAAASVTGSATGSDLVQDTPPSADVLRRTEAFAPMGSPVLHADRRPPARDGSAIRRVPPELLQSLVDMGFTPDYAAHALEASGGDINTALETCMGGEGDTQAEAEVEAPAAAAAGHTPRVMIRRTIDADNSCLFNSVGYTLRRRRKVGAELRQIIADAVRGSPDLYTEAILGKRREEYCRWILNPESWGGEIELSILSKKLAVLITVVDIQTNNAYSYGEGQGFDRRIFIIYDGVHYDALAEVPGVDAPEADDATIFDPRADEKVEMAKAVAADLKQRNQFTDMGKCNLKCMVCMKLLKGEDGAMAHARLTSHQNFGQI